MARAKPIPTHCDWCGASFDYLRGPSEFKKYKTHHCPDCRNKGYATITHGLSGIKGDRPPEYMMWSNAKNRAKKFNVPFDLDVADIIIPEFCPVLGIPLVHHKGEGKSWGDSPSLDRIIPDKGYVKSNVMVISKRANAMKNDGDLEDLRKVYEFYKNLLEVMPNGH